MKRFSKLFVSFLLISALTFCAVLSVNAAPLPLYGDVLSDGSITVADATQISKYLTDSVELTDEQLVVADYNGDGKISVDDVTAIQKMLAGLPYKYTHNLYEVEYAGFSAEELTAVSFNADKNYRTYDYRQSYPTSISNLLKLTVNTADFLMKPLRNTTKSSSKTTQLSFYTDTTIPVR